MINVSFNGSSLQTYDGTHGILVRDINPYGWPNVNVKKYPLAHANQSVIPYEEWQDRTIPASGTIIGTSLADLESQLDTFKSLLLGIDKNLDIDYNGGTRRFYATVDAVSVDRPGGLTYADFQIEFTCSNPFGHDTTSTTALNQTGRTSATYNDSYTFLGTAPYQRPVITITLTAVSSSGSQYLSFGNGNTGQAITITRSSWASGDVVVIDTTLKTVTINSLDVAFTGAFPEFAPGAGTLQYFDSFTSRTFNITATYTVRYL